MLRKVSEVLKGLFFYSSIVGTCIKFIILQVTEERTFASFSFMQIRSRCSKILLLPAYQGFPSFMNFRVNLCWRRCTSVFTSFVKRSHNSDSSTRLGCCSFQNKRFLFLSMTRIHCHCYCYNVYENVCRFCEIHYVLSSLHFVKRFGKIIVQTVTVLSFFLLTEVTFLHYVDELYTKFLILRHCTLLKVHELLANVSFSF